MTRRIKRLPPLFLLIFLSSCASLNSSEASRTQLPYPLVGTISHDFTRTPQPSATKTKTTTPKPSSTAALIRTPTPTHSLTPTRFCDPDIALVEFPLDIDPDEELHISRIRSHIGRSIPPLPDGVKQIFSAGLPYGEVPWYWPYYSVFVVQQENSLMLWLGVPYSETDCCGKQSYVIYDSIPLPQLETNDIFVPFFCSRDKKADVYLIGIITNPIYSLKEGVRYAWRINPETTTLDSVSIRGVECRCWW